MDSKATVQALMDSIQKGDFAKAKTLISDDFIFSGPVPEPVSGDAWLAISKEMKIGFPDLEYHFHVENMIAETVSISAQLKGTHTGPLDLSSMNMGVIPPTNRAFSAERETGKATVKGDQVTSWVLLPTEGAGMKAILGQLGVRPPTM
jgi:predicted ester cyclase